MSSSILHTLRATHPRSPEGRATRPGAALAPGGPVAGAPSAAGHGHHGPVLAVHDLPSAGEARPRQAEGAEGAGARGLLLTLKPDKPLKLEENLGRGDVKRSRKCLNALLFRCVWVSRRPCELVGGVHGRQEVVRARLAHARLLRSFDRWAKAA